MGKRERKRAQQALAGQRSGPGCALTVVALLVGLPLALLSLREDKTEAVAVTAPSPADPAVPEAPRSAEQQLEDARAGDARMAPMSEFASDCFRAVRARNPVGRLLSVSANRLADQCAAVVETADGSGQWLFDYRREGGFRHYGGVLWPEVWPRPAEAVIGVAAAELAASRVDAVLAQVEVVESTRFGHWLYEPIWLPAPFERTVVFVFVADLADGAEPLAGRQYVFVDGQPLDPEQGAVAVSLYPSTRFELREDHNFKGPLFESTALAESAISLEGAPLAFEHPLATVAERCLVWVRDTAPGSRVLRLALDDRRCWLTVADGDDRERFDLLSFDPERAPETHGELVWTAPAANLLLDRSRISVAVIRERLAQGLARLGAGARLQRLAVAWVEGAMVWQIDGMTPQRALVYLDAMGQQIAAPAQFPNSTIEAGAGFAPAAAALAVTAR